MPRSCKCILDTMVHKGAMTKEERDKILRNLKGFEWHPYPQEKPDTEKDCLITTNLCNRGIYGVEVGWLGESGWHSGDELYPHDEVVAWAELPKPYEEGAEE